MNNRSLLPIRGFPMEPYGMEYEIRYKLPKATITIIIINVIIYLIASVNNGLLSISNWWLYNGGFIPILLLQNVGNVYRIFTSMFLHADILHIFFNMYFLYIFGKAVENTLGSGRFVILYLLSGISASIFHTAFTLLQGPSALAIPAIGASGAISGVLGAYLMLYPGTSLTACWFFFFLPMCFTMSAAYYLLFWFALQVIYGYARLGASIAFFAHAGGFVAGIALLPLIIERSRHFILKMRSVGSPIFDFIVYSARKLSEGLPKGVKILLTILIASLLIGGVYVSYDALFKKTTGIYVAKVDIEIPSLDLKYTDNVVLKMKEHIISPTDIPNDETRVLLNRLIGAKLLLNPSYAGREIVINERRTSIIICDTEVPVVIHSFRGIYDSKGILVKGEGFIESRVVKIAYIGNICHGILSSWIDYKFRIDIPSKLNIGEGIVIASLITIVTSLTALYVTTKLDRDIVIVGS